MPPELKPEEATLPGFNTGTRPTFMNSKKKEEVEKKVSEDEDKADVESQESKPEEPVAVRKVIDTSKKPGEYRQEDRQNF